MDNLKQYLEERIIHLKKSEMEYFDKQYKFPSGHVLREYYRQFSNELCGRRNECEMTLKFLSDSDARVVKRSEIEP